MQRKLAPRFKGLVGQLSRDPRLKRAIAKARRQSRGTRTTQLENLAELYLLTLTFVSHFLRKKKARALEEHMDLVSFLVQLSLSLKENVFDRPEVKQWFARGSRHNLSASPQKRRSTRAKERTSTRRARREVARTVM